jgi:hypothetical protein
MTTSDTPEATRPCGHSDPRSCDLTCRIEAIEQIIHPEGRCAVCGGGKPYWKHLDARASDWHPFTSKAKA